MVKDLTNPILKINESLLAYMDGKKMTDEEIKNMVMDESFTDTFQDTMNYVEEREIGRTIAHKIGNAVDATKKTAHNVYDKVSGAIGPLTKEIRHQIDEMKKARDNEDKEIVITDSQYMKLARLFKRALPFVAIGMGIGPLKAIIAFFGACALGYGPNDNATRDKLTRELETELKLTREKIDDARSNGDNKAKYQLMRLEGEIEDQIARIKYGKKV